MYNNYSGFGGMMGLLSGGLVLVIIIVYLSINIIMTGWLASQKGYSVGAWVALSIFFGPIALLGIGFAPDKKLLEALNNLKEVDNDDNKDSTTKTHTNNWVCSTCNTRNKNTDFYCLSCGASKK